MIEKVLQIIIVLAILAFGYFLGKMIELTIKHIAKKLSRNKRQMERFKIKLGAFVREGKLIYIAEAEREDSKNNGQLLIWKESEYLEDAIKELGKEMRKLVEKELKQEQKK